MQSTENIITKIEIPVAYTTETQEAETNMQTVEVEILPPVDINDKRAMEIYNGIKNIDEKLNVINTRIDELNAEIDNLTNHADGIDYAVAVASGILTGLLDSIFVGDFNPNIEDVVKDFANKKSKKPINSYEEAQKFLADNYHTKHDGAYMSGKDVFGKSHHVNGHTHRMDDFTHHPTLMGLVMSILVRFLRVNLLFNKDGESHLVGIKTDAKDILSAWGPAVLSGIMMWLANVAEQYAEDELDTEIPESIRKIIKVVAVSPAVIEILKCADEWYAHIISDVSTNKGIPGIFLSFLKELSALPILNKSGLPQVVQNIYNSKKMNFASEVIMIEKLKKQAIPVIANELIVRGFYFVRRLCQEIKENDVTNFKDLDKINWKKTIPFGNRTVERMMTIASGTFVAVDVADAAIRSGGFNPTCLLRLNFVGIGRFVIAIGVDIGMGIKKHKKERERSEALSEYIGLANIKIYYREADLACAQAEMFEREANMHSAEKDVWYELQGTAESMEQLYAAINATSLFYMQALSHMDNCSENMVKVIPDFDKRFPGLREKMLERIK